MSSRESTDVLVTGGAGFLGARVVQSYLDSDRHVRVVGHAGRGARAQGRPLPARLEFVELDLCDLRDNLDVFAGQSLVVHTAAMIHAHTPEERVLQRRINVDGTRDVIEACRRNAVPRLIHVSSTAAIGISRDPGSPADEGFRFNLGDLALGYNRSKQEAERLVLDANGPELETIVVNPGFMFGSHHSGYRGREVVDRVLRRFVVPYTRGGMSLVHVDDVVDGIRRVDDNGGPGQRYILSGENLSFAAIARTVCQVAGVRKLLVPVPNLLRDLTGRVVNGRVGRRGAAGPQLHLDRRYAHQYHSSERARTELGYQPRSFAHVVGDALEHIRHEEASPRAEAAQPGSGQGREGATR